MGADARRSSAVKVAQPDESVRPDDEVTALVENDGLFVHFLIDAKGSAHARASIHTSRAEGANLSRTFGRAFSKVWDRIPLPDRLTLLSYWRTQLQLSRLRDSQSPRTHRPLIHLVLLGRPDDSFPVVDDCGHTLRFFAAMILEQPKRLPFEIAGALVDVFRFANGRG